MPQSCFSYSSDMPPGAGIPRSGGEMGPCFSYSDGILPVDLRRMPEGSGCFNYQADGRLGDLRRMPEPSGCFGYYE